MSDQPEARNVPVWAFVAVFAGVALAAGGLAWLFAGPRPAPLPVTQVPTPTATVSPTSTVTTQAPEPTSTAPATATVPATAKEPARVTNVSWSASKGYAITVDYVQILTGKAAADAATAAGQESPPPNDYFIANTNKKLRTFALPKSATVIVLGWAGSDATKKKKLSVSGFMDIMPGGANTQEEWADSLYYVTVKKGTTVTRVEQIFFP